MKNTIRTALLVSVLSGFRTWPTSTWSVILACKSTSMLS